MSNNIIPTNEHLISLSEAAAMTRRYRENRDTIIKQEFAGKDLLPICETFNKDAFNRFFTNPLVKALRIYYGMSENLQIHAIIVGVNEKNEDMLPQQNTISTLNADPAVDSDDPLLEEAERCPPLCPPPSELNAP